MKNFINKLKPYRNYILSLALLIGLANYFFFDYFPRQRQNRENIVAEFVNRINQSLPSRIDEIITMIKVSYFPPDKIVFNYILELEKYSVNASDYALEFYKKLGFIQITDSIKIENGVHFYPMLY